MTPKIRACRSRKQLEAFILSNGHMLPGGVERRRLRSLHYRVLIDLRDSIIRMFYLHEYPKIGVVGL